MKNHTHQRFELGTITISSRTQSTIHLPDVLKALKRHSRGDWGRLDAAWRLHNDEALTDELAGELISEYRDRHGHYFFVVTNSTRSETRVTLQDEPHWPNDW